MPVGIDSGNPNVFRLYKGKYALQFVEGVSSAADPTVMLTANDVVLLLRDVELQTYTAGARVATVPDACRPAFDVEVPVVVAVGERRSVEALRIGADGLMSLGADVTGGVVKTCGISYNIAAKYYRQETA